MSTPDESQSARQRMIDEQLIVRGIRSPRVLEAMARVPRERFVPDALQAEAYADRALPIECEQTISQPYIVALMTEALELASGEKVLEIGAGSGYQTALLAELAASVIAIERHAELAKSAAARLQALGYNNITFIVGDGSRGWPEQAPYDRVLVAAAAPHWLDALFEQLAEGGILVAPFGPHDGQTLLQVRKVAGQPVKRSLGGCRFVPLVGEAGERQE